VFERVNEICMEYGWSVAYVWNMDGVGL
jgi:hypothetical protein